MSVLKLDLVLLRSLAIGAIGGTALGLAQVPGGWLAGAMIAVAALALSGIDVRLSDGLRNAALLAVGISMGTGVTPQTLALLPSWPITIALVIVSIPLIGGSLTLFLMRYAKWDRPTAVLASMPGALSYLISIAPTTSADVPRVAIVQTIRVAILVAVLPIAALLLADDVMPVADPPPARLDEMIMLYGAGIGGGLLAALVNVPAGLLIGGLFVSAILYGSGLVVGHPPLGIAIVSFVVMGVLIGTRFAGTRWRDLGSILGISLTSFAIGTSIAIAIALIGTWITDLPLLKLMVAFAPGGLEAMVILAFAMDLDPAFVAAHHLIRFLLIAFALPFVIRGLGLTTGTMPPKPGRRQRD